MRSEEKREWETRFQHYFGLAWDDSTRQQVLDAMRMRKAGTPLLREIERVVGGLCALERMLDGQPPPQEEPQRIFKGPRERDETFVALWAFEQGLVPFASGPAPLPAVAVVCLLMRFETDVPSTGAVDVVASRLKSKRTRYRKTHAPTPPEVVERIARARELRELEAQARQALDVIWRLIRGPIVDDESVPDGTVPPS